MKLFGIKNQHTNQVIPNTFFADKQKAKAARDELNDKDPGTYVVTPGPDHHKAK